MSSILRVALPRIGALALAAGLVTVSVAPVRAAVALAFPGQHLWHDWVSTSGVYEDEQATAVTIAPGGHPVVVGTAITAAGGDRDIRYVSYDAASLTWRWNAVPLTWGGAGGTDDTPAGVVVDAAGDVYVAGTSSSTGGGADIVLLKVLGKGTISQPAGTLLWVQTYDGPAHRADEAEALAIDGNGNVCITGGSQRADGSWDVVTLKYRPDGTLAWRRTHNNGGTRFDRGLAITVHRSAVYVAGLSRRTGQGDDAVIIKYGLGGKRSWVRYFDDVLNRSENVTGIACHGSSVYVCGSGMFTATKPGQAMVLCCRAADGAVLWSRFAGAAGHDSWNDIAVDGQGRVHVAGTFFRKGSAEDITTSIYRANGLLAWRAYFSSVGSRPDTGTALAVDGVGRTYVCGSIQNSAGDADMAVLCYAASATAATWFSRYPDPVLYGSGPGPEVNLGDDRALDIALVSGAAFVVGESTVAQPSPPLPPAGQSLDFQTVKLAR